MTDAPSVLFQYGLAGVVILGLTYAVVKLYTDNQSLHKQLSELQDARRLDAKETNDKVTEPLKTISQSVKMMADKILIGNQGS